MSIELTMLLWTVALFFVQLMAQVFSNLIEHGVGYALGSRDEWKAPAGVGSRIERAYYNLLESLAPFAALVLIVLLTGQANEWTALGAQLFFWARLLYFPIYIAAVPAIRTLIWLVSVAGMGIILWQLLAL